MSGRDLLTRPSYLRSRHHPIVEAVRKLEFRPSVVGRVDVVDQAVASDGTW